MSVIIQNEVKNDYVIFEGFVEKVIVMIIYSYSKMISQYDNLPTYI